MKEFLLIFLIVIFILALCFLGLAIKILVKKKGEFKRECASCDPYTAKRLGCVCGKDTIDKPCKQDNRHSILEVNKNMLDELR
ncbi:MAG: hypothetical protein LBR17_02545 [Bacteroidales bacterium]|jgi:hypothetical protein|nr:hypothetical protein [Bacteroidales bacterium]